MSHIVQSTTKFKDLDALAAAVERLGGEFQWNKLDFAWWGSRAGGGNYNHRPESEDGTCLHAIKVKGTNPQNGTSGPWEIGVKLARDGDGYELEYDYYGSAGAQLLQNFGGQKITTLTEEYAAEVAMRQLARAGFRTTRTDNLQTVR